MTAEGTAVPRRRRDRVIVGAIIVGVLIGGGLRFIPSSDANTGSGEETPGSTACAAQ